MAKEPDDQKEPFTFAEPLELPSHSKDLKAALFTA